MESWFKITVINFYLTTLIASYGRMTSEKWIGRSMRGSGCCLVWGATTVFELRDWRIPRKTTFKWAGLQAEIWIWVFPNIKQFAARFISEWWNCVGSQTWIQNTTAQERAAHLLRPLSPLCCCCCLSLSFCLEGEQSEGGFGTFVGVCASCCWLLELQQTRFLAKHVCIR